MSQTIHELIRNARIQQNLSIQTLSKLSGVSASHISRIERRTRNPSLKTLRKLAPFLQIDYYTLIKSANFSEDREEMQLDIEELFRSNLLFFQGKPIDEEVKQKILEMLYEKDKKKD